MLKICHLTDGARPPTTLFYTGLRLDGGSNDQNLVMVLQEVWAVHRHLKAGDNWCQPYYN